MEGSKQGTWSGADDECFVCLRNFMILNLSFVAVSLLLWICGICDSAHEWSSARQTLPLPFFFLVFRRWASCLKRATRPPPPAPSRHCAVATPLALHIITYHIAHTNTHTYSPPSPSNAHNVYTSPPIIPVDAITSKRPHTHTHTHTTPVVVLLFFST